MHESILGCTQTCQTTALVECMLSPVLIVRPRSTRHPLDKMRTVARPATYLLIPSTPGGEPRGGHKRHSPTPPVRVNKPLTSTPHLTLVPPSIPLTHPHHALDSAPRRAPGAPGALPRPRPVRLRSPPRGRRAQATGQEGQGRHRRGRGHQAQEGRRQAQEAQAFR